VLITSVHEGMGAMHILRYWVASNIIRMLNEQSGPLARPPLIST
jgi:hypothetical protein